MVLPAEPSTPKTDAKSAKKEKDPNKKILVKRGQLKKLRMVKETKMKAIPPQINCSVQKIQHQEMLHLKLRA